MSHDNGGLRIDVLKERGKPKEFPKDVDVIIYRAEEEDKVVVRLSDKMDYNLFMNLFDRMERSLAGWHHTYKVSQFERSIELWFMEIENVEPFFFG